MKKKVEVKIHYVKRKTTLILAIICFIVGLSSGIVFYKIKNENSKKVRKFSSHQSLSSDNNLQTPQSLLQEKILYFERIVANNPNNSNAWVTLGNLYFDTKQVKYSIRSYKKYLEINPKNPNVWTDLGVMYRQNSQPEEALKAFNKAIGIDPKHEQTYFNKGIVLFHDLNKKNTAIKVWKKLLEINPLFMAPNGKLVKDMIKNFKNHVYNK